MKTYITSAEMDNCPGVASSTSAPLSPRVVRYDKEGNTVFNYLCSVGIDDNGLYIVSPRTGAKAVVPVDLRHQLPDPIVLTIVEWSVFGKTYFSCTELEAFKQVALAFGSIS